MAQLFRYCYMLLIWGGGDDEIIELCHGLAMAGIISILPRPVAKYYAAVTSLLHAAS